MSNSRGEWILDLLTSGPDDPEGETPRSTELDLFSSDFQRCQQNKGSLSAFVGLSWAVVGQRMVAVGSLSRLQGRGRMWLT